MESIKYGLFVFVKFTAAALVCLAGFSSSFAYERPAKDAVVKRAGETPGVDKRMEIQQKRIDAGVASGRLSTDQAATAQGLKNKLSSDAAVAKADGKVTKEERSLLHSDAKSVNQYLIEHRKAK